MNKMIFKLYLMSGFLIFPILGQAEEVLYCSFFGSENSSDDKCAIEKIVDKQVRENPEEPPDTFKYAEIKLANSKLSARLLLNFGKLSGDIKLTSGEYVHFTVGAAGMTFPNRYMTQIKIPNKAGDGTGIFYYLECTAGDLAIIPIASCQ